MQSVVGRLFPADRDQLTSETALRNKKDTIVTISIFQRMRRQHSFAIVCLVCECTDFVMLPTTMPISTNFPHHDICFRISFRTQVAILRRYSKFVNATNHIGDDDLIDDSTDDED